MSYHGFIAGNHGTCHRGGNPGYYHRGGGCHRGAERFYQSSPQMFDFQGGYDQVNIENLFINQGGYPMQVGFGGGYGQPQMYMPQQNRGGRFLGGMAVGVGLTLLYQGVKNNGGFKGLLEKLGTFLASKKPAEQKPADASGQPPVDTTKVTDDADAQKKLEAEQEKLHQEELCKQEEEAAAKLQEEEECKLKEEQMKQEAEAAAASAPPVDQKTEKGSDG